jgi:hypothetical protein
VLGWHFCPRPSTIGRAQWLCGPTDPCQPALHARSAWSPRGGAASDLGVARLARTPWGSDGDCVGQGGVAGFSPETVGSGGAEKTARRNGGAPVAGEGVDESYSCKTGHGR